MRECDGREQFLAWLMVINYYARVVRAHESTGNYADEGMMTDQDGWMGA